MSPVSLSVFQMTVTLTAKSVEFGTLVSPGILGIFRGKDGKK